jgi:hypothetical protein
MVLLPALSTEPSSWTPQAGQPRHSTSAVMDRLGLGCGDGGGGGGGGCVFGAGGLVVVLAGGRAGLGTGWALISGTPVGSAAGVALGAGLGPSLCRSPGNPQPGAGLSASIWFGLFLLEGLPIVHTAAITAMTAMTDTPDRASLPS